jgi:ATP-dependent DNA helicase RecG
VLDGPLELTERWLTTQLPFELTATSARRSSSSRPTSRRRADAAPAHGRGRLGKTVVALFALLRAVEHGRQAALMAPTETLAEQHFATLQALMPGEAVPAALLTGSTPAGRRRPPGQAGQRRAVARGRHARAHRGRRRLRPARRGVVDEQHRFGVRQRTALDRKAEAGLVPHVLHMTATPIPRTLALLGYGDLDVTTPARAAQRAAADLDVRRSGERERRAPTSASARSCAPGARRTSSARS